MPPKLNRGIRIESISPQAMPHFVWKKRRPCIFLPNRRVKGTVTLGRSLYKFRPSFSVNSHPQQRLLRIFRAWGEKEDRANRKKKMARHEVQVWGLVSSAAPIEWAASGNRAVKTMSVNFICHVVMWNLRLFRFYAISRQRCRKCACHTV